MSISDVHQRHQPTNDNDNDNDTVTASDLADALRMYGPYICDGAEMSHVPYTHTLSLSLSLSLRICSLQYAVYFANVLNLGTFLSGAKGILFFFFTCAVLVVVVVVLFFYAVGGGGEGRTRRNGYGVLGGLADGALSLSFSFFLSIFIYLCIYLFIYIYIYIFIIIMLFEKVYS